MFFFPSVLFAQHGEFTLKIIDEETQRPLPCRVMIRNEKGVARRAEDVPFLYDHFVMPGEVKIDWPLGTYPMEIVRGLEYLPRTGHFVLNRYANDAKTETLKRFTDLSKKGWWSGDLMVLRNLEDAELLMLADDVHFVPLAESQDKKFFSKQKGAEAKRAAETRARAGRTVKKDVSREASDEKWFDADRLFTTQNYILRHPACCVGILNLPQPLNFEKLSLETRRSVVPMLYAMRHNYPDVWFDVQDADCWDLPLLVALGLADSYQILGPHILRGQMLPENICWKKLPVSKTMAKINTSRLLEEENTPNSEIPGDSESESNSDSDSDSNSDAVSALRQDLFRRPSQCEFIPDAAPMNYRGERGRQMWTETVYFHLLNTGHRIPPSAGSGSGLSPNAVGANRMYVFIDPEEFRSSGQKTGYEYEGANAGWTRELWWKAVRAGRVVVTNGPLLLPGVEGCVPGEVFSFPANVSKDVPEAEKVNPAMTLMMQQKAQYIDIIMNGRVVQSIPFRNYAETGRLPLMEITESGWFLIRVVADVPQTYCCAMSAPYYVEIGKEQAISRNSAQFFVNWEQERVMMLEKRGAFEGPEGEKLRKLHEYAVSYWQNLLKRANKD